MPRAHARPAARAAALLCAVATLGGGIAVADEAAAPEAPLTVTPSTTIVGGPVRLGDAVYLHRNAAHSAPGLRTATVDARCDLRVTFDQAPDERIVSAIADEDETMSGRAVHAVATAHRGVVTVRLEQRGTHVCADDPHLGDSSNIWLSVLLSAGEPS